MRKQLPPMTAKHAGIINSLVHSPWGQNDKDLADVLTVIQAMVDQTHILVDHNQFNSIYNLAARMIDIDNGVANG